MPNLLVHHVTIKLLNMLYYYVMEEEVAVYQNTERKFRVGHLLGAVAVANSNDMRTHASARTSIGIIAKES